jgi:hypothetical protein
MKRILIAAALCIVMVGLMAAPAFAATQRVVLTRFPNVTAGYATFTTDQGDRALVVGITVTNATPRAKYRVYLFEGAVNCTLGYLTTNSKGKWGGQNEQYEFSKVLSVGEHTVQLKLMQLIDGSPDPQSKNWLMSPVVTINITRN